MKRSTPQELIPVTLLTGFLGSGKTTLLNHLVQQPEMADALVIINEFGEMPLDHMLVAHSTDNVVMEMSSGCLCCTIRKDLATTLNDIAWRFARNGLRQFRRVVIETTGLADPAPILHTLMTHPRVANRYRLDGVVATFDLAAGPHTLMHHAEAVKQVAMADYLLLTKTDLVTDEERAAAKQQLDSINPAAPCSDICHGKMEASNILDIGLFSAEGKTPDVARWLKEEAYISQAPHSHHDHDHSDVNRHDDHIRAFCFAVDDPIPEGMFEDWLEVLMNLAGSNILRVKGILNIAGRQQPLIVHGVQHIFYPPVTLPRWPDEDRRSRIIFITQDVDQAFIESTFHAFHHVLLQAHQSEI